MKQAAGKKQFLNNFVQGTSAKSIKVSSVDQAIGSESLCDFFLN